MPAGLATTCRSRTPLAKDSSRPTSAPLKPRSQLQEFARSDENREALRAGREALRDAEDRAAEAVDRLSDRLSPEELRRLEELRDQVPEIPENIPRR